jgi:hypothetical protein
MTIQAVHAAGILDKWGMSAPTIPQEKAALRQVLTPDSAEAVLAYTPKHSSR